MHPDRISKALITASREYFQNAVLEYRGQNTGSVNLQLNPTMQISACIISNPLMDIVIVRMHRRMHENQFGIGGRVIQAASVCQHSVGRLIYKLSGGNPHRCSLRGKAYSMYGVDLI